MNIYPYEYMYIYHTSMNIFERLRADLLLRFTKLITKSVSMSIGTLVSH
jgi:hypothetical protein